LIKNTADARGGAIFFNRGPATISRTKFKGNRAAGDGGAVYFLQACLGPENHLSVGGSKATNNSAGGAGGAFFSYCNLELRRSYIGNNSARGPGGGIFSPGNAIPPDATTPDPREWGSSVFLWQSTITANRSGYYGGGVAFDASSGGTISGSTVSGNAAKGNGGGLGLNSPAAKAPVNLTVGISTVANNSAAEDGGGIATNDSFDISGSHAAMTLDHVTIARNQANTALVGGARRDGTGGGIFISNKDHVSVHNSILALNTAALAASKGPHTRATDCSGTYDSLGHNLIGNAAGCLGFGAVGDLFGGKLKLGKLAMNGGPTKTIALQKGSRAIGHADRSAISLSGRRDQRGFKWDKKPDIGAFDRGAKP
jgi:predicted outer membrane repeat protein